jgi:hypothetical protein
VRLGPFKDELPTELSGLCAILIKLFPEPESIDGVLRHLPSAIQHPPAEAVPDAWAAILLEAHRLGEVISILKFVREADEHAANKDLVQAVQAYRSRCGLNFETIAPLAAEYVQALVRVRSSPWQCEADWTIGTRHLNRSLRSFAARFDELRDWPIGDEEHEDVLQTVDELLAHSRELLDRMRRDRAKARRQRALEVLTSMGGELKANIDRIATSGS